MMFRIESQRDAQTLAPDAIRGIGREMIQASAGRQNHCFQYFQYKRLSPRWGWRFFARPTPRSLRFGNSFSEHL